MIPIALALVIVAWVYLSPVLWLREKTSSGPNGYYGLLTEAFYLGQLHLNIPTDPKLFTLENPYAGPQGAHRPHDMSYYRGRFYLYYGVTPALLVYLPWRCITGTYLNEWVGTVLMLFAGFVLAAFWLIRAWRRWFPHLSPWWPALMILTIGLSPPLHIELGNQTFYIVPIAGAFFCLMVALTAADRALAASSPSAQAAWLAMASLFWGLAAGARPIYVLGLVVLSFPALWLWWQLGRDARWRWTGLRLLAATVVPAAVIGAGLMTYNYLRFDDPFDFGIRFSMATGDLREAHLVGPEFIPKNLALYLLHAVPLIRYFPFVMPGGGVFGVLPHLPFVALAIACPLTWFFQRKERSYWVLCCLLLLGAGVAHFSLLCVFFGEDERYLMDFVPPLFLLAAVTALALLDVCRSWARVALGALVVGLAVYAMFSGITLALSRNDDYPGKLTIERLFNWPAHLLEQKAGTLHGPVELTVTFPEGRTGTSEPLVSTGYGKAAGDIIAVHYVDKTHVQFRAFHVGRGGPLSEPVEIDYGVPHRLRIALGSLYPPAAHPAFAGWLPAQVDRVRRRLKVELDDRIALQGNFTVYPSTPPCILVGRSEANDVTGTAFTGRILAQRRLGLDPAESAGYEKSTGPVRLTVRFPQRVGDEGLPLVATGTPGRGDLLFAHLMEDGLIRFGHDSFGGGAVMSPAVPFDPEKDHVVEIEMGSLQAASAPTNQRQRLRVSFDGIVLMDLPRTFHPSAPEEVEFGFNTIQASTAISYFPGALRAVERISPAPPLVPNEQLALRGPLRLVVEFPVTNLSPVEPLLTTGQAGRADVLFVRYESNNTVRFGLDHWSVGAAYSEPVTFDRSQPQILEIRSGALLPPENDPAWNGRPAAEIARLRQGFEVRLGGRIVFAPAFAPYAAGPGEISLGENLIGASTCAQQFSGRFLLVECLPW